MSKAKIITSAGIIAAGSLLSSIKTPNLGFVLPSIAKSGLAIIPNDASNPDEQSLDTTKNFLKRKTNKVYHRFEEIPEISDKEAALYPREEYTYIINADKYQKDGTIELKRVLKKELTQANALSLMYRSECADYIPDQHEDQLVKYEVDLKLINSTGKYKGPSQMNDTGILLFVKYLAANPETRKYVLPLLKTKDGTKVETVAKELEQKFFTADGKIRNMDERDAVISSPVYKNLILKDHAWKTLASRKLKRFIAQEEIKRHKHLSNTTKNYLCLTELFPSEQALQNSLEEYNLAFFPLARPGKPKTIMESLAKSLNLKDKEGNPDATRLPTFTIAAALSHINWKGNGLKALFDAKRSERFMRNHNKLHQKLRIIVKAWVNGKGKTNGVDELAKLNIITPDIISQYQKIELPGAEKLAQNYQKEVIKAEQKVLNMQKLTVQAKAPSPKTLILSAKDFSKTR